LRTAICANGAEIPMAALDGAVLEGLLSDVLRADIVTEILTRATEALKPADAAREGEALRRELAGLDADLGRLGEAISAAGAVPTLLATVKAKEARRTQITEALARLDARVHVAQVDLKVIGRDIQARLDDWRGLLTRHPTQARQILRKLLETPLVCDPIPGERRACRFKGEATIAKLVSGLVGVGETGQQTWRPQRG
jgi:hypothetical protein